MAYVEHDDQFYIQNEPIILNWGGFTADTHALLHYGWRVEIDERDDRARQEKVVEVRVQSPDGMTKGWGEMAISYQEIHINMKYHSSYPARDRISIGLEMGKEIYINPPPPHIYWEPAGSQKVRQPFQNMEQVKLFAPDDSKQIIVPQYSMNELMDFVLEKQEPNKQQYYEGKCKGISKQFEILTAK